MLFRNVQIPPIVSLLALGTQGLALALPAAHLTSEDLHVCGADFGAALPTHEHVVEMPCVCFREFHHILSSCRLDLLYHFVIQDDPIDDGDSWDRLVAQLFRDFHVEGLVGLGIHDIRSVTVDREELGAPLVHNRNLDVVVSRHDHYTLLPIEESHCGEADLGVAVFSRP